MYYKIASILLNSERQNASISDIFVSQPDASKEDLVGKLFILAEIESQKSEAAKILTFLINNISFNYYQNEKVILKERIETISIENIFESALAKTNSDLLEFLTEEKIKISPYAFNLTVCVLYKNELYFSNTGKNKNFLIYKEKILANTHNKDLDEPEKTEYQITNLSKEKENASEVVNINKLFSEVTGGKIPAGGYFIIINEALSEYLSQKQLLKIVTKLSPAGAAEQIRNMLEQVNSMVSFLGIIVKNNVAANLSNEELRKKIDEEIKGFEYQPEITTTEKRTERIMTSAGVIDLKKWLKTIGQKVRPEKKIAPISPTIKEPRLGKMFLSQSSIFFKKRATFFSLEKISSSCQKTFIFSKRLGGQLIKVLNNFFKKSDNPSGGLKISLLNRRGRYILIAAIALIVILGINLTVTDYRNKQDAKIKNFNVSLSNIEKNQNKIEADLLYGNEAEALQLLNENKIALAQFSAKDIKNRQQIQDLIKKQQDQLEKTSHVVRVGSTKKTADFSTLNGAANPENLITLKDTVYAGDFTNKAIYKIDLKGNTVTAVYNLPDAGEMKFPSLSSDGGLYYLGSSGIINFDKTEASTKLDLPLPNGLDSVGGVKTYIGKLYLLDKKDGQIYRYSSTATGFTKENQGWINGKNDLSGAVDIAIDGSVYILFKDGHLEKYLKGQKTDFSLPGIEEPLSDANRLLITKNYIYILESSKKRIAIFTFDGKFVEQDIFETVASIKDFTVDESLKKIYLLDGASVSEADIDFIK